MNKLFSPSTLAACLILLSGFISVGFASASETIDLPDGSKLDLSKPCPVCEMKIVPGPNSPSAIIFSDGSVVGFDANSDYFKYLLKPDQYGYSRSSIKSQFVKGHDTGAFVDATKAFFVVVPGSTDVMGIEITAFIEKTQAEKFAHGKTAAKVLTHSQISLNDLQPKKKMLKMKDTPEKASHKNSHGGH
jgi:nitrous oxide reductase accessory protein NosL